TVGPCILRRTESASIPRLMMSRPDSSAWTSSSDSRSPASTFAATSSSEIVNPFLRDQLVSHDRFQQLGGPPRSSVARDEPLRPFAREPFARPLARRIDAHLAAVRGQVRRVL